MGVSGRSLPSARLVSSVVHPDSAAPHGRYSLALMQWGTVPRPRHHAHAHARSSGASTPGLQILRFRLHRPPRVPADPHTHRGPLLPTSTPERIAELYFVREIFGGTTHFSRREQMDQVTAYIDSLEHVRSDACEARMLRSPFGGRLNSTKHPLEEKTCCLRTPPMRHPCQRAARLTSITPSGREHNPGRSSRHQPTGERRHSQQGIVLFFVLIVSITSPKSEFLPRVLGEKMLKDLDLVLDPVQVRTPACRPTVYNEFAAARIQALDSAPPRVCHDAALTYSPVPARVLGRWERTLDLVSTRFR
ncbi:hypothetical protein JTE90_019618 [Oedothorax gibbosus]|uniref:Uncharacterized protein n=1 Tax=Oedothorax gibbosus TaxID=931172 RepID=A0AAV6TJU0_9ARAC|nr:hypothetical protein JTE90_019618 [Oedothorax gibbosus]